MTGWWEKLVEGYKFSELVASFRSRRSCAHGSRCMAIASYESGAVRKWWDSVAEYKARMRVIAAFFGPYAPYVLTAHVSVFSHDFKRFGRFTKLATSSYKTRNQLTAKTPLKAAARTRPGR